MAPPRVPISVPSSPVTERCLRTARQEAPARAVTQCRGAGRRQCEIELSPDQMAAASRRLRGVTACRGVRQGLLARPTPARPTAAITRDGSPEPRAETRVVFRTAIDERIASHRQRAMDTLPRVAAALRARAADEGVTLTDAQHAAALEWATLALRDARPVLFERVSAASLPAMGRQPGLTRLVGGAALLSADGRTVLHPLGRSGERAPGGLYDPDTQQIFVNVASAGSPNGSGVFLHEALHAYLFAVGVPSTGHRHHRLMAATPGVLLVDGET